MIIKIFGEEKEASKIVKNILKARKIKKISRVTELVQIIGKGKLEKLNNRGKREVGERSEKLR